MPAPLDSRAARPRSLHGPTPPGFPDLFGGGAPHAILARLVEGDPLEVRPRVGEYLRREALFLDADRVHLRALAICAYEASRAPERGVLGAWLEEQIERAARAVLKEDALATRSDGPPAGGAYAELAEKLHLDPAGARAACVALALRPRDERIAFLRLVLERNPLDEVARDAGVSASEVGRRARRALDAALDALEQGSAQPAVRSDPPGPQDTEQRS